MDAHENNDHPDTTTGSTTPAPNAVTGPPSGAPLPRPRRPRRTVAVVLALSLATTGAVVAVSVAGTRPSAATTSQQVADGPAAAQGSDGYGYGYGTFGGRDGYGTSGGGTSGPGSDGSGSLGDGSGGSSGLGGTSTATGPEATAAQQVGVVTIVSTLGYSGGEAAGTGMVLTSGGEVLTNNHVVSGATSLAVTVESTGVTYTAEVVGTDATDDVAVLQLVGASGLATVATDTVAVAAGTAVTAVGNAGGTGTLTTATGTITATGQSITTQAEASAAGESLTGLLRVDADIIAGDSGGPLLDADGEVIGIDTAASSGSAEVTGYAIPISTALAIADQIESGRASTTITIGLPAFLGVQLSSLVAPTSTGALLAGVQDGTPAARAGLAAGDTITAIDGSAVDSADALSAAVGAHAPGDRVSVTWVDADGASHTATVTLAEGPAA